MKTLDRYVVRQFLINFVILLVVLTTLFVAVNVIIDLDNYLEQGKKLAQKSAFNADTLLRDLKAGNSVAPDLTISTQNGRHFFVSLSSAGTVGDVMSSINAASGGAVTAQINPAAMGLELVDATTGTHNLTVALASDSTGAADLGIVGSDSAHTGRLVGSTIGSKPHNTVLATLWCVFDYNGPMVLLLYVFFCGLVVVGAMGFTFAGLYRAGELVAVVSSGVSMYRIAAGVLVAGFVLNALSLPTQEYLIPPLAGKLVRDKSEVSQETVGAFEVRYAVDSHSNLISASAFDPGKQTMKNVSILVRTAEGLAQRRITASQATWSESPEGWKLVDGHAADPGNMGSPEVRETPGPAADVNGGGAASVQGTPLAFFPTELSPAILLAREASFFPRLLSLSKLEELSQSPSIDRDQIRQIMHSRFSLLVVNMLILVMGLPFFLMREPVNMLQQGVKGAAVTLGAWGAALVMLQVGTSQINPVAAAWLPVVIYLPVSAAMLLVIKS